MWKTDFLFKNTECDFYCWKLCFGTQYRLKNRNFLWQQFPLRWHRRLLVSPGSSLFPKIHRMYSYCIHRAILETSWETPAHQANEKIPTWKQVAQAETYLALNSTLSIQSRGNPQLPAVETQHTKLMRCSKSRKVYTDKHLH